MLFEKYHSAMPFVGETFEDAANTAARKGVITTLLGRKRRFDLWEPRKWGIKKMDDPALPRELAEATWGKLLRRAYTHKGLNAAMQGGAADIMKTSMVQIWDAGICNVLGAPLLTVHDELDWSAPPTTEAAQALAESQRIMETCVSLRVPLRAEREDGANWGNLK